MLKTHEYLTLWQQTQQEPSLDTLGIDLDNENVKNLPTYFNVLLTESVLNHPSVVGPLFSSQMAQKMSGSFSATELWFRALSDTLDDLSSYEIYDSEGVSELTSCIAKNFKRFHNPASRAPKSLALIFAFLNISYEGDGDVPLLGYEMIERLLPLCTKEEKETFCITLLTNRCSVHALEFVKTQQDLGVLSFPQNEVVYKEAVHTLLSEDISYQYSLDEQDVSSLPKDMTSLIGLLEDHTMRNDAIRQCWEAHNICLSQGRPSSVFNIDHFCGHLPEYELQGLLKCILDGNTRATDLPPFLKSYWEKQQILEEISLPASKVSSKKM